jgi:hypothetical protein
MATPADWASTIAVDAAADGCDAALRHDEATHTRKPITMFDAAGEVSEQSAIDIFTNGHVVENLFDPESLDS